MIGISRRLAIWTESDLLYTPLLLDAVKVHERVPSSELSMYSGELFLDPKMGENGPVNSLKPNGAIS